MDTPSRKEFDRIIGYAKIRQEGGIGPDNWMNGVVKDTLRRWRDFVYPPQSCAVCAFCVPPLGIEGAKKVHLCAGPTLAGVTPRFVAVVDGLVPECGGTLCSVFRRKEPVGKDQ